MLRSIPLKFNSNFHRKEKAGAFTPAPSSIIRFPSKIAGSSARIYFTISSSEQLMHESPVESIPLLKETAMSSKETTRRRDRHCILRLNWSMRHKNHLQKVSSLGSGPSISSNRSITECWVVGPMYVLCRTRSESFFHLINALHTEFLSDGHGL